MGTLADLVGGIQSGYTGVQDARRRRKLNQAIDYELGTLEERRKGRKAGMERLGYDMSADFTMPKTYGERLFGYIKSKFGGQQDATAIDPGMQSAGLQESGARTYGTEENQYQQPQRYRDGGAVRNMKRYANGGRSIMPDRSSGVPSQKTTGRYHVENPITGYTDGGMALPVGPGQMAPQNMGATAIPTPSRMMQNPGAPAMVNMADGGLTDEERMRRSYGDEYYVTEEEAAENRRRRTEGDNYRIGPVERTKPGVQAIPTSGGGAREFAKDLGRSAAGYFDDTVAGALGGQKLIDVADEQLAEAKGAREKGRAMRETGSAALTSAAETTGGLLKDVFVDNPITQGALGFLGYTGEDGAAAPEVNQDKKAAVTEAVAPRSAIQPGADVPNTQTPQAQNARQPAGPPDEIVDFTQVRDVMPEDMPNMAVKDWEDERRFWAAQAIALGNDPFEAMKAVDARQMRGFQQYGQQAFQMLQAGDATGAARALYAAYQYFPNGADVRFGVQTGANGQPVLIGMGTDEETGEPAKKGKPMVITPESLSVQIENLTNPSAFRTWTKDWRTAEQEIREYEEVKKPSAQAQARYQDRAGRAALIRAEGSAAAARTGGGMKQTDLDRANSAFTDAVEMEGFENPEQADFMMSLMADIYQRNAGRVQYPIVIADVRNAIRSGSFDALEQKYGL